MEQNEQALREQLVRAGNRLLESGLVARTWGNLSARLSDTEFLITPSGLAYERLTPEDMAAGCRASGKTSNSSKYTNDKYAKRYEYMPNIMYIHSLETK